MQRKKLAAAFALLVVLSSTPSFAIERNRESPGEEGPIDRIVQILERLFHPVVHILDEIGTPKP